VKLIKFLLFSGTVSVLFYGCGLPPPKLNDYHPPVVKKTKEQPKKIQNTNNGYGNADYNNDHNSWR